MAWYAESFDPSPGPLRTGLDGHGSDDDERPKVSSSRDATSCWEHLHTRCWGDPFA